MEYQTFMATWKTHQDENTWPVLENIINMPMRLESILQDLSAEVEFDPEIEPVEDAAVDQKEELAVEPVEEHGDEVEEAFDEALEKPPAEIVGDSDDDKNVWVHLDEPPQTPG